MRKIGWVLAAALVLWWLIYNSERAFDCESSGGAYVKTFGGYTCVK